jgi:hypothetical protein
MQLRSSIAPEPTIVVDDAPRPLAKSSRYFEAAVFRRADFRVDRFLVEAFVERVVRRAGDDDLPELARPRPFGRPRRGDRVFASSARRC